jgi:hypothetical protein
MSSLISWTSIADASGHRDQPQSTPEQVQGGSMFGDSSGPFFSIYSKAAEDEDNKMVERWQKDADGILIFVSLISAIILHCLVHNLKRSRPVYSLLQSPHSLP